MVKVRIPRSEDRLLGLLVRINNKHKAKKKQSLLNGAIDMDRLILKYNNIQSFKNQKSNETSFLLDSNQVKKIDLKFISNEIHSIRNLLLQIYPDEPKILEEWGFELKD